MNAGDISEVEMTPRHSRQAPERFTVDSYDGRSKDIRKYHRSETLVQNVDSLSLRNRTVLTPSPTEVEYTHVCGVHSCLQGTLMSVGYTCVCQYPTEVGYTHVCQHVPVS